MPSIHNHLVLVATFPLEMARVPEKVQRQAEIGRYWVSLPELLQTTIAQELYFEESLVMHHDLAWEDRRK